MEDLLPSQTGAVMNYVDLDHVEDMTDAMKPFALIISDVRPPRHRPPTHNNLSWKAFLRER